MANVTSSLKIFNSAPYRDDFDLEKGFYRILFKPGKAVQARELTQLQTILQNQIEQFGRNIYKDGTVISGGEVTYTNGSFIKVQETTIDTDFEGASIVGVTSGATGVVKKIVDGFTSNSITYSSALHYIPTNGVPFSPNEVIRITGTTTEVTVENSDGYGGSSYIVDVNAGIYFVKGAFVYADSQTALVSSTFVKNPSSVIGYKIVEGIKTSDDDESLLDPAAGTNNYFAPGADRYYIDLVLSSYPYDPTVQGSASTAVTDKEFIKKVQVEFGVITSYNNDTQFNEIENFVARRTFDQSGDFTVKAFSARLKDHHYGNVSKMSVEVSPGKAYVKGYGYETKNTNFIDVDRARDSANVNGYSISLDYGRFLDIKDVVGFLNFNGSEQVALFNCPSACVNASSAVNFYSSNHIGNARARFLSTDDKSDYKLYLFDFRLKTGNTISQCNSIITANILASTKLFQSNVKVFGNANVVFGTDDTYLFPVSQENIKTFKDSLGATDTTSLSYKLFPDVSFTASGGFSNAIISLTGTETFVGSGTLSDSAGNDRFYVAVTTGASGTAPYTGNILSFSGTAGDIQIISSQQAKLIYGVGQNFTANIVALTSTSSATAKVKTLTSNTLSFTTATAAGAGAITANLAILELNKSDIANVTSITDSNGTSYLNAFRLDSGQRDQYYDHGRLIFTGNIQDGNANITLSASYPYLNVEFNYYVHTGTGFFNVDSYLDGGLDYGLIPTYTSSQGKTYRLSDVIDYRPVRQNDTANIVYTFVSDKVPNPDDTITADYSFYLPRRDKLVLTRDRELIVRKGISAKSPKFPEDQPDAMTLYTLDIPAYTANPEDVKLVYINNKRYTMRDIGKIEKRVDRLEYYTALSFLEKIAADARIPSSIPGIDRFKNGILVDAFAGMNVADVRNPDLLCSIDFENRLLRPRFSTSHIDFSFKPSESVEYTQSDSLLTMSYTTVPLVEQLLATAVVNASPFEVFEWVGRMTLSPSTDVWGDIYNNPAVTVNVNGENDAFTQITLNNTGLSPWGTRWNDWQSVFKGVTDVKVDVTSTVNIDNNVSVSEEGAVSVVSTATTETTARTTLDTQESFARSGLQFSSAAKTITSSLGEKTVDVSIIPFIRSRPINFVAQQMKPDSVLFASFDGVDVTDYCVQASRLKVVGANTLPTTAQIRVYNDGLTGGGIRSEGNVIFQRGNVIYYRQNNQTQPFETSNTITLVTSSGLVTTTTANSTSIATLDIPDNGILYTDSLGVCAGIFVIPNDEELRFNLGERAFKLTDSLNKVLQTTAAETKYLAYGLSTTKEETILATRMNLVSIDPLLEVKKSEVQTSVRESTSVTKTTGTSNEAKLPQTTLPPIVPGMAAMEPPVKQTFFCGETEVKSSGGGDEKNFGSTYKVHIGSQVGSGNVIFQVPKGAAQISIIYNGQVIDSGMISNELPASGVKNSTLTKYDERLTLLNLPPISVRGPFSFPFIKQKAETETLLIKVFSPLADGQWSFKVDCPAGTALPAPGTAQLTGERKSINLLWNEDQVSRSRSGTTTVLHSAKTDVSIGYVIENTSKSPKFSINGTDKSFEITNIEIIADRPLENLTTSVVLGLGTSLAVEYGSGETVTRNGTVFPSYSSTETRPRSGQPSAITSLPHVMVAGQKSSFSVRVQKDANKFINGHFKVRVTAQGPVGSASPKTISVNEFPLTITTSALHELYPKDPLSQTFFVDGRIYGKGVFIDSIDVWFREKDDVVPVNCEIRPVVNGYPSSFEILPFASIVVNPENVVTSTTFDSTKYTRFKFKDVVHLPPGQYAFVIQTNSTKYVLYSAILGQFQLDDTTKRVIEQPYIGSLFKSQNASTWTPEQNEDLTFRINVADFGLNKSTDIVLTPTNVVSGNVVYDLFNTTGDSIQFPETTALYSFRTTKQSTVTPDASFRNYSLGSNVPMDSRKIVRKDNLDDLKFKLSLSTQNRYIAPVFDIQRLGAVLVQNVINNDSTAEDQFTGGNALAKYISRRVILNPGFEAQDLKVYLNAFLPNNSSIKVYYKVNAPNTVEFDSENKWTLMTESAKVGDERNGFAEFTFSTSSGFALTDQSFFNTFAVKVVMLSDDPVYAPIIKDLRVIAIESP